MLLLFVWGFLALVAVVWIATRPLYWWWRGVPQVGGIPLPLVGTCWPLNRLSRGLGGLLHLMYLEKKEHPFVGFHLLVKPCMLVVEPALINDIMIKSFDSLDRRSTYLNIKRDLMARNVIHLGGDQWRTARSKMTPYFTPAKVKSSLELAAASLDLVKKQLTQSGPVDIHDLMIRYTTDVLTGAVFGIKSDAFEENSFFDNLQKTSIDPKFGFRILLSIVSHFLYDLTGSTFVPLEATAAMQDLTSKLVQERSQTNLQRNDFLQAMIELKEKDEKMVEENMSGGDKDLKFDLPTITAQLMALYTAGTESSGLTLGFLLYELAVNPSIQERARNEISKVIEESESGKLDYDTLQQMNYINMIISETLRKYPVFPFLNRRVTKPYRIPGTDIVLDTNTPIFVPAYSIHHDPKYYPDPDKFDPERFTEEMSSMRPSEAYLPFGMGPRTCLGMKFALNEMSLALCTLLTSYRFSICPGLTEQPIRLKRSSLLTSPESGIWVNVDPL